ncbi:hypothetical protein T484DRAFT_1826140 [Baffinella frigidus]|nr:hypothetical protein T484DRAFT_1826140 [Cryptophyta sp. CCMP2293]
MQALSSPIDTTEAPPFQAQIGTNGTRKGFSIAHVLQLPAELPTAKEVGNHQPLDGFSIAHVLQLPATLPSGKEVEAASEKVLREVEAVSEKLLREVTEESSFESFRAFWVETVSEELLREVTEEGMGLALALHLCCAERYPTISAARNALRKGTARNALRKGKVLTPDMAELDTTARGQRLAPDMAELDPTARVRGGEVFLVQQRSQPGHSPVAEKPFDIDPGHAPVGEKPFDMDVIFEDDHLAIFVKPQTEGEKPFGMKVLFEDDHLAIIVNPQVRFTKPG